jgi:hypothetical protein
MPVVELQFFFVEHLLLVVDNQLLVLDQVLVA